MTAFQQNLGHDDQDTTLHYIGHLDAEQRSPKDAYGTSWLQGIWNRLSLPSSGRLPTFVNET